MAFAMPAVVALVFDWDPAKARVNQLKHGVAFPEAAEAFDDHLSGTIPDPRHGWTERRFVTVGQHPLIEARKDDTPNRPRLPQHFSHRPNRHHRRLRQRVAMIPVLIAGNAMLVTPFSIASSSDHR
jgi:hypothetical protein